MERKKLVIWLIIGIVAIAAIVIVVMAVNGNKNKVSVKTPTETTEKNYTETAEGTKVNTSVEVSKEKKVAEVLLEQSKIVYENGMSKLTSKVTNNGAAKDNLRFKVKFIGNDGSVIAESVGFVGQINANEVKYIDSYITLDVSNSKDVTYELM